jgi:hypothetical protein
MVHILFSWGKPQLFYSSTPTLSPIKLMGYHIFVNLTY